MPRIHEAERLHGLGSARGSRAVLAGLAAKSKLPVQPEHGGWGSRPPRASLDAPSRPASAA
ncbi:MAG: hypothetical protein HY298_07875 [Verrucomicrobia bacterium]|nr:hypothetical protein [Verrucomicrobiota bacterium]